MQYDQRQKLALEYELMKEYAKSHKNEEKTENQLNMEWIAKNGEPFHSQYENNISNFQKACNEKCNGDCKGVDNCVMEIDNIKKLTRYKI